MKILKDASVDKEKLIKFRNRKTSTSESESGNF